MPQVRLRWNDPERASLEGLHAGPWLEDTPFNRGTLETVLEAGIYARGPGSYWLEAQAGDNADAVAANAAEQLGVKGVGPVPEAEAVDCS